MWFLFQQFFHSHSKFNLALGGFIDFCTEAGEACHLFILGKLKFERLDYCFIAGSWGAEPTRETENPT